MIMEDEGTTTLPIAETTTVPQYPIEVTKTTVETIFSFLTVDAQSSHKITWSSFPYANTTELSFNSQTVSTLFPLNTLTLTELDIVLIFGGAAYSTLTTTLPTPNPTSSEPPFVFVEPGNGHGWDDWSDSEKGGLIAGIILVAAAITVWLAWIRKRNAVWIAPEWLPYHA